MFSKRQHDSLLSTSNVNPRGDIREGSERITTHGEDKEEDI